MQNIKLRIPEPGEFALAARDTLRPEYAPPFVLAGLCLALLTNVLTGVIATVGYAYLVRLWERARQDTI